METAQAIEFLHNLLGKNFRITTSDTRMFLGQFKCTDAVGSPRLPETIILCPKVLKFT